MTGDLRTLPWSSFARNKVTYTKRVLVHTRVDANLTLAIGKFTSKSRRISGLPVSHGGTPTYEEFGAD